MEALNLLFEKIAIETVSVTKEHATIACQAYCDYGRRRHPAKLNFGDCFSNAMAKLQSEPLLFKGNYFNQTDIACCIQWVKKT